MSSPILAKNKIFSSSPNQATYGAPLSPIGQSASPMTMESTIVKTATLFGTLLVTALVGWLFPIIALPAVVIALVIGLVNAFKKEPSVPLIVFYALFEGAAIGGISNIMEKLYSGVVIQAVLATLVTVGVVLALFASGKIRASKRATKVFFVAIVSYMAFSIVNLLLSFAGVISSPFGLYGQTIAGIPIGILIGALAILIASYSLVLDFTFIQNGVNNKAASKYEWLAGYGILVSVVWIYIEFLRIFGLARR